MIEYLNATRAKACPKKWDGFMRVAVAADEHIEGGVGQLGPGMDRDMAFGQDQNTRDAAALTEVVEMTA